MPSARELWPGDNAPRWWHGARQAYDRAVSASAPFGSGRLLAGAGAVGRLLHRLPGAVPSPGLVAAVVGDDRSIDEWRGIAREISALRYRNRATLALVSRHGAGALDPLLERDATDALQEVRGPVVVLWWHVGPAYGLSAAIARAGLPVLSLRRARAHQPEPGIEVAAVGDSQGRALAFARAVVRVRGGGIAIVPADGQHGTLLPPVSCLGRAVCLARGPFALARLTGAPLVPVVAHWSAAGRIGVVVGARTRVPRGGSEDADLERERTAAGEAARWFERHVRQSPGQLWVRTMRWVLAAPRA